MTPLANALGGTTAAGRACGLEHEYQVWEDDRRVDFRRVVQAAGLAGAGLDPGDPHAHRGPWGGVVTADGLDAEVASPPSPVAPGFTGRLAWWAEQGRRQLEELLPPGARMEGYSTHLSISVEGTRVARGARTFAERFAPAMMLLLDRADSPGMLVRPRPGRLELCGEHATGAHLRAAAALGVGATLACDRRRRRRPDLPPVVRSTIEPARIRHGWYVDRAAFGTDLYEHGRRARLHLADGTTTSAHDHLARCWDVARAALEPVAGPADLLDADRLVDGALPLPTEDPTPLAVGEGLVPDDSPFARLALGTRPTFALRPVAVQWHGVAFAVDGAHRGYLWVPEPWLAAFLLELRRGSLDGPIAEALAHPPRRSLAASVAGGDAGPAAYGSLGDPAKLVLPEPDPRTGRSGGRGGGPGGHRDKEHGGARSPIRRPLAIGAAMGALIGGGGALALGGDADDDLVEAGAGVEETTTTVAETTTTATTLATTTTTVVVIGPVEAPLTVIASENSPDAPPGGDQTGRPAGTATLTCRGTACTIESAIGTYEVVLDGPPTVSRYGTTGGQCDGTGTEVGTITITLTSVPGGIDGLLHLESDVFAVVDNCVGSKSDVRLEARF